MTSFEDIGDGVKVYGAGLHPIYAEHYELIARNNPEFTAEEAFQQTCMRVGELAAQAEQPKRVA